MLKTLTMQLIKAINRRLDEKDEQSKSEASCLSIDEVMNLYMRIIYALRKKGKQKSAMHGRLVKPSANGKQINWDPVQRHDKNYVASTFERDNLILARKQIVNAIHSTNWLDQANVNVHNEADDDDKAVSAQQVAATKGTDAIKKGILAHVNKFAASMGAGGQISRATAYLRQNSSKATQNRKYRKTTMSEEEVAKDPQINFEYFGYMSDSDGEEPPDAGQDARGLQSTRRSRETETGRSLATEEITDRTKVSAIGSKKNQKLMKKMEPFQQKKPHREELELVDEDDEDNYYGDRVRGDKLEIFEFVKPTKSGASRINRTHGQINEKKSTLEVKSAKPTRKNESTRGSHRAKADWTKEKITAMATSAAGTQGHRSKKDANARHSNRSFASVEDKIEQKEQQLVRKVEEGVGNDPESQACCSGPQATCSTF